MEYRRNCVLIIKRDDNDVAKNESYRIYINKIEMGSIGNNETAKFNLKNGEYEMYLQGNLFSSKKVRFSMNEGQIVEFQCKPNYQDNFFSKIVCRILKGGKGISLELKQDIYL